MVASHAPPKPWASAQRLISKRCATEFRWVPLPMLAFPDNLDCVQYRHALFGDEFDDEVVGHFDVFDFVNNCRFLVGLTIADREEFNVLEDSFAIERHVEL